MVERISDYVVYKPSMVFSSDISVYIRFTSTTTVRRAVTEHYVKDVHTFDRWISLCYWRTVSQLYDLHSTEF